jgi:hypothetical protein
MNLSTIQVLARAADLGLKLGFEPPDTLTLHPVDRCSPDFADTLRAYKRRLLPLFELPFVMVFSESLADTVFFCEDEATRAALVEAGAAQFSIYTKDELRVLVAQNRAKPFLPDELCKLHTLKRTFNGRFRQR